MDTLKVEADVSLETSYISSEILWATSQNIIILILITVRPPDLTIFSKYCSN
jgi:hypothetical protein